MKVSSSTSSSKSVFKAPGVKQPTSGKSSFKSLGAVKALPGPKNVTHSGQPQANGGGGLKTGHTATNTGSGSASSTSYPTNGAYKAQ